MLRRPGLALTVVGLALVLGLGCAERRGPPPTNVLLVSIDTLRPDRLGAYGGRDGVSPAFDALAREGVLFERAVAASSWTLPSHASLLTSLWPSVLDLGSFGAPSHIAGAAETLAEVLAQAGFRTMAAAAGGFVAAEFGFDQGFERFLEPPAARFDDAVDSALRWLDDGRAAGDSRPFFLFLHTYDVHNYVADQEDHRRFVDPRVSSFLATRKRLGRFLQQNDAKVCASFDADDWRHVAARYDAAIASADRTLGRLVAALAERGLLDDTLVVLTSDHGEELGEHGRSGHGYTLFDENVRVPLVLRHPSLAPARVPAQVPLLDVAPTVVDLLDLAAAPSWQGRSLAPLLDGDGPERAAFAEGAHVPFKMLRMDGWKYVLAVATPHERLFDLTADPGEHENLARAAPDVAARFRDALARFVRRNAEERRFRGGEMRPSDGALHALEQFGYLGPGGSPAPGDDVRDEGRRRWLHLLEQVEQHAAARDD